MANDGFGNSFGFRTKLVDAAGICMTRLSEEEGGGSGSGGTVGGDGMGMGGKEDEGYPNGGWSQSHRRENIKSAFASSIYE